MKENTFLNKLIATIFIGICFFANAQKSKVKSIEDDYKNFAYVKTIEVLKEVADNGYRSKDLLVKLANSYYFNNKMDEASRWYGELFKDYDNAKIDSELFFRYAIALRGTGNYEMADEWMRKFNEIKPSDSRGTAFLSKVDYRKEIDSNSNFDIEIKNLALNSEFSDFGIAELDGRLLFASTRGGGENYKWNNQPFLDFYTAVEDYEGNYTNVQAFDEKINTQYHESIATLTQDERLMFFTRNNFFKNKARKDGQGVNRLQMFRVVKNRFNEWETPVPVHFNSPKYSVAHPTLNKEGTRLYFASDMPGTMGMSDIYVVNVNRDGTLGEPRNLGASINTEGQESFPFVNTNGDLYYSSNGLHGLGGKDIFISKELDTKLAYSAQDKFVVENIGKPFNSPQDDFAFYENLISKKGYFSSNRPGGKGDDDIYSFNTKECGQTVNGIVTDIKTNEPIAEATVILFDVDGIEIERLKVGNNAKFTFELQCEKEYLIRAEKDTYSSDEKRFTTPSKRQELEVELQLEKEEQEFQACDDLAKILNIPRIYFNFDKYDIRPDAEVDLQKILAVLNKYPTMTIDIRSHTDSRGTNAYNLVLSDNRAKSSRQYLIDQGIDASRITAKGYGESRLINRCYDLIDCSEAEHQRNRRSEFIVTGINGEKCNK